MKLRSFNGYFKNGLGGDGTVDVVFDSEDVARGGLLTVSGLTAEQAMRVAAFIEGGQLVAVQGITEVPYPETTGGKRTRTGKAEGPKPATETATVHTNLGPAVASTKQAPDSATVIAGMDAERDAAAGAAQALMRARAAVARSAAAAESPVAPPEQLPLPSTAQAAATLGGGADMGWLKAHTLPPEVTGAGRALHLAQELRHRGVMTQEELTRAFTILKARGDVDVLKGIDDVGERVALLFDRLPPIS